MRVKGDDLTVYYCLEQRPGAGKVGQSPLHHLATAQARPDALGCTLCRRVGHSSAPCSPDSVARSAAEASLLRHLSCRSRQKCSVTPADESGNHAGMDEQDLIELLELQRLTREFLDHLTAMFAVEQAAGLLRAMTDGVQSRPLF